MKKLSILIIVMIFIVSGCSSQPLTMYENEEQMHIQGNGFMNLPMPFYYPSLKYQDNIRCFRDKFCSKFPEFKEEDFTNDQLWGIMTSSDSYSVYTLNKYKLDNKGNRIRGLFDYVSYDVYFTTATYPYEEREREIEAGNTMYMKNYYIGVAPENVTIEYYGKEKYPCVVIKTSKPKQGKKEKMYSCFKFNSERTMAKKVGIRLVYTKSPTLPKELEPLAKEYTYEDLLKRSQRVLDSLYIKDGWDE